MLSSEQQSRITDAFILGQLRVRSVSPEGAVEWQPIRDVSRAEVGPENIWEGSTEFGVFTLTGGHRVFVSPTHKVEMESLRFTSHVLGVLGESIGTPQVLRIQEVGPRKYMYDLTADKWHNFVLHRSKVVVSNSPDRNYHFRPPAHEETVTQFNKVFGFIWEDAELDEYLQRAMDQVTAAPPRTPFQNLDQFVQTRPEWRTLLLNGAMMHALFAVMLNWISDEFDYSIGGVSLTIEKSSKYESAYSAIKDSWESQLERAKQTVKIISGLQQPRYGIGIRSSFGPYTGAGVLTPAKFIGF